MAFVSDTFTDTNGTTQTSHTGETGATWTQIVANDPGRIFSNVLFPRVDTTIALQLFYASGTPTNADYTVAANINYDSGGNTDSEIGLAARINTSTKECYFGRYSNNSGAWEIYYTPDGAAFTLLASFSEAKPTANYLMTFIVNGTTLTLKKDSTTKVTTTNATISAKGKAGMVYTSWSGGSQNYYGYIDYTATDGGGAALSENVASVVSFGTGSVVIAGTAVTGGTATFSYQLKRGTDGSTFATSIGSAQVLADGVAPSNVTDNTVTDGILYYYRWSVTDSAGSPATVNSNIVHRVPHAAGTTFHVATAGSDSNVGSSGSPWQTMARANLYTDFSIKADDVLAFNGGDTISGNLHVQNAPGTSGHPFTVTQYGSGTATISASDSYGVWLDECQYTTVKNLTLTGSGVSSAGVTTSTESGVKATLAGAANLTGITIQNNIISGFGVMGVYVSVANGNGNSMVSPTVTQNTISACGEIGIAMGELQLGLHFSLKITSPSITLNTIHHIYGRGAAVINRGYGMFLGNCNGGTVSDNLVHHNGEANGIDVGGPVGILTFETDGLTIKQNEVHHQYSTEGVDGQGIDLDGGSRNCIVERNYIHDCDGPAFMDLWLGGSYTQNTNNVFRWNITQNNGRRSAGASANNHATLITLNLCTNPVVQNNAEFAQNATGSETKSLDDRSTSGATIRNNTLIVNGSGRTFGTVKAGSLLQGNRYYAYNSATFSISYSGSTYTSLAALQAGGGEKVSSTLVGSTGDPQLTAIGTAGSSLTIGSMNALVTQYDPSGSASLTAGLNLFAEFGVNPGSAEFHGQSFGLTMVGAAAVIATFAGVRINRLPRHGRRGVLCG